MSPIVREVQIGPHRLIQGDCLAILPLLGAVDVTITDPPYSAQVHEGARGKGATTGGAHILVDFAPITSAEFLNLTQALVEQTRRWVVMTCDRTHAAEAERAGLPVIRLGVWTKADPAPQFSGDRPGTGWEPVVILHRPGRKRWNGGGRPAVWHTKIVKNGGEHPTQKPLELIGAFVRDFTEPGETVLDPFAGSGTTLVAALKAGRRAIGIERDPKHFATMVRRVSDAYAQPDMLVQTPPPAPVQETLEL